jgi:hypothetical protein
MMWSTICARIGVPENVTIGNSPPAGMVVESYLLEQSEKMFALLEEYDLKPDILNTAFYISSDDGESLDEEYERILEEDYDW